MHFLPAYKFQEVVFLFKLLLVEDEYLTREGIVEEIPWRDIGISQVVQAVNGFQGIELSVALKPDIVLADVRMPGMNGVEMAFEIRKLFPDCKIIFMSGYSDKEYLKAAIELKAISYVEKPLNIQELKNVLAKTAALCQEEIKKQQKELANIQKLKVSIPYMKNEIALQLINKNADYALLDKNLSLLDMKIPQGSNFITLIADMEIKNHDNNRTGSQIRWKVYPMIKELLTDCMLSGIYAFKSDKCLIIHLIMPNNMPIEKVDENFCKSLCDRLSPEIQTSIAMGSIVHDMRELHRSYDDAVSAMQRFFYNNGKSTVMAPVKGLLSYRAEEGIFDSFSGILSQESKVQVEMMVKKLCIDIGKYDNTPINYTKGIFYELLLRLESFMKERGLSVSDSPVNMEFLWENILRIKTLKELEDFFIAKVNDAFSLLAEKNKNSSTVSFIMKFIHNNYSDELLSIKTISEKSGLSLAYICTLFKEETGKTINQYLTDYRMNKAKELLRDKMLKVNDIASRIGYCDGNYLAKTFRKVTGMSPSDYRKRYLS